MPSEFDTMCSELRAGQAITSLSPAHRREIEARIAEMKAPTMAKSLPVEPAWPVTARVVTAPKRQTPPPSTAKLAADAKRIATEVQRNHAAIGNLHRQKVREGTRERTREILAKALAAFHAGRLTAHQVSVVEARAHRVMDAVAGMEHGR